MQNNIFNQFIPIVLGLMVSVFLFAITKDVLEDRRHYREMTRPNPVPTPEAEERPVPYYGSIDLYNAAKIELVFYADMLASELPLLNHINLPEEP